ncbi:MAG: SDR family oxidoreductase [Deltaproteobacteria bacterium]|nr:SDR family oxidoreductase [Deltaproteobacteria bacterium]
MRLKDKVALVTGSSQGLGLAIARRFALEGARVFLGDIKEEAGRDAAAELTSRGVKAWFVRLDVSDEESWKAALAALIERAERLDVLVNNAGINIRKPIEEMTVEELDRMLAVNVRGPFLGIKHALPLMRQNGGGSIINMGSVCSLIGHKFTPEAYTTVKGAVSQLTRSVAVRYAKDNIRANVLCPSTVETPLVQEVMKDPERRKERVGEVPLGRLADMEDVASAALYLASDEATFINGVTFPVDGGVTAW